MGDDLQSALSLIPGLDPSLTVATPLAGGLTNRNFRLEYAGQVMVLRLGGENAALLGINRQVEFEASSWAAACGLGAGLVFADADQDVLVTHFIAGRQLSGEEAARPEVLSELGQVIRRVHEAPTLGGRFSPFDTVRAYHARTNLDLPDLPLVFARMEEMEQALGESRRCPCHNDLLAGNFIHDQHRWRLIDWEYAAMGDPYFDLGNFAVNQELDEAGNRALLRGYGVESDGANLARLELMRLASDLREAFWGFLQAGISQLDVDYSAYGQRHLHRFLSLSADERYTHNLEAVR